MTGVNISFITDKYGLNTAQTRLPDITGGIVVNNISTFADDVYNHIFEEPLVEVETFSAILATGYQQVELKGILNAYNGYDTDEDTLTDWKEVDVEHWLEVGLITYNDDNTIKLPTVEQCMKFTEVSYVESALDRLQSNYGANFGAAIANKPVMPISSDPTSEDGDGDLLCDKCDKAKLFSYPLPEQICEYINEQKVDCCQVRTSDDGFVYVGESITDLLKTSGIVDIAFQPYQDWHIFSISMNDTTNFGLCKLRPHSNEKDSSFAVSFCDFDIEQFDALCCDNYDKEAITALLDNYINLKSFSISDLILNYYADASNDGFYVLANEYIETIIESECITDHIDVYELGRYQNNVFNSLATDTEKESQCFYISDPENLTNLEKDKILLLRSGNPSIYSFAAEIYYHARMTKCLDKIINECYNNNTIPYFDLVELLSLNKSAGMLTGGELGTVAITCYFANKTKTLKDSFLLAVCLLYEHAVKSDAGTGTSGTAFSKYLADFFHQVNFDVLIDDVFYNEYSMLIQLAKENHSEESAYNY